MEILIERVDSVSERNPRTYSQVFVETPVKRIQATDSTRLTFAMAGYIEAVATQCMEPRAQGDRKSLSTEIHISATENDNLEHVALEQSLVTIEEQDS